MRGEPVIIQRQIFFEGVVYEIEEELYSDADASSVYTSEDDFDVDRTLQTKFQMANPLNSEKTSKQYSYLKKINLQAEAEMAEKNDDLSPIAMSSGSVTPRIS